MVINLRGTSGSGKSTTVKQIMKLYPVKADYCVSERKQPLKYLLSNSTNKFLQVIGHYEISCGGADTIPELDEVYDLVRKAADYGDDVLFEGVLVSGEAKRCIDLHKDGYDVRVIGIDHPLDDCLESIVQRRIENGNTEPFDPRRTIRRQREVRSMMKNLKDAGVPTEWLTRNETLIRCKELLSLI